MCLATPVPSCWGVRTRWLGLVSIQPIFGPPWATIQSGRSWHGEVCNRHKSGRLYWVDTLIVPFVNEAGNIERYVAISSDISERKQTRENLLRGHSGRCKCPTMQPGSAPGSTRWFAMSWSGLAPRGPFCGAN